MSPHSQPLPRLEVLASLGLRLHSPIRRKLNEFGIYCEPLVTKAPNGSHLIGYESGGAVGELGIYCSFVGVNGQRLVSSSMLQTPLSRNGKRAMVIDQDFVRVQILRNLYEYHLLLTRHQLDVNGGAPVHSILLHAQARSEIELWGKDAAQRGMFIPEFHVLRESIVIPLALRLAVMKAVAGACCIGCHHLHLLLDPESAEAQGLPTVEQILSDPATSQWLKQALSSALERDLVDAANDAELLAKMLDFRSKTALTADIGGRK